MALVERDWICIVFWHCGVTLDNLEIIRAREIDLYVEHPLSFVQRKCGPATLRRSRPFVFAQYQEKTAVAEETGILSCYIRE
jgi:hypothetical protein